MGELLKGTGTVLMLRYQEGSAATEEREQGFLDELRTAYPGITVISSDQYAGPTRDTAKRASENLLNRFARRSTASSRPTNRRPAACCSRCRTSARPGTMTFVGFDFSSSFLEPLAKGELTASSRSIPSTWDTSA